MWIFYNKNTNKNYSFRNREGWDPNTKSLFVVIFVVSCMIEVEKKLSGLVARSWKNKSKRELTW
jgi:hypothetical protein